MKYQAIITINIDGRDAYDIQAQRETLAELTANLRARYDDARLEHKARRRRVGARAAPPSKPGPGFEVARVRHVD